MMQHFPVVGTPKFHKTRIDRFAEGKGQSAKKRIVLEWSVGGEAKTRSAAGRKGERDRSYGGRKLQRLMLD
jgi:hypothetical protein